MLGIKDRFVRCMEANGDKEILTAVVVLCNGCFYMQKSVLRGRHCIDKGIGLCI